jgi:hypothetical protein
VAGFRLSIPQYDDWALTLGKFVENTYPDRDFAPELPPPFKMLEFEYEPLTFTTSMQGAIMCMLKAGSYTAIENKGVTRPIFLEGITALTNLSGTLPAIGTKEFLKQLEKD